MFYQNLWLFLYSKELLFGLLPIYLSFFFFFNFRTMSTRLVTSIKICSADEETKSEYHSFKISIKKLEFQIRDANIIIKLFERCYPCNKF